MYNIKLETLKQLKDDLYDNNQRKYSNYFLTINTQQQPTDQLVELFEDALTVFFENFGVFVKTRKGFPKNDKRDIVILPVVEIGGKKHRLHCHATVEIEHQSNILLDYTKIRKFFKESLDGFKEIHFDAKVYKNSRNQDNIKSYILKTYKDGNYSFKTGNIKTIQK